MGAHRTIIVNSDLKIEQLVKDIINSPESQIIIEVPKDCSLLVNEINVRLLKFYAEEEEKELIIKTVDPVLISFAQRIGISTIRDNQLIVEDEPAEDYFDSYHREETEIAAAPEVKPESSPGTFSRQERLIPAILALLFTLILAVWWFFQPRATIIVYPKEHALRFTINANISPAFHDDDISAGKIPAQNFVKQSQVIAQIITTGRKIIGVTPAIGRVLLINSTNQPVMVAKGSIITGREGIRFLTDKDVLVPKKATKMQAGVAVGEEYGKVEVGITAEKKGTAGNQPIRAITRIEGKYQNLLKVANLVPTRNGTDKKVNVVTVEDVKKGEAEVKRQMQLATADEARSLVNEYYLYLPDLAKSEIIKITNKPEIGSEGESVQTELDYRVFILAPTVVGVQKYLNRQFERNIPPNFEAKNHQLNLLATKVVTVEEEFARLELVGQGQIRGLLNQRKIKELIKGKSLAAAEEILIRQDEIADVKIKLNNQGTKLPGFGFQIKILFPAGPKTGQRP